LTLPLIERGKRGPGNKGGTLAMLSGSSLRKDRSGKKTVTKKGGTILLRIKDLDPERDQAWGEKGRIQ